MTDISGHLSLDIQTMAASSDKASHTIVVREKISGECTVLSIRGEDTIASLKSKLQEKTGASPEHLNVFLAGSKAKLGAEVTVDSVHFEKGFEFNYALSGGGKSKDAKGAGKDLAEEVAENEDVQEACCEMFAALLEG